MKQVNVSDLRVGSTTARDIYSQSGKLLLPKGATITDKSMQYFLRNEIQCVYIEVTAEETPIEDEVFEIGIELATNALTVAVQAFSQGEEIPTEPIDEAVTILTTQSHQHPNVMAQLRVLSERNDHVYRHSLDVALMSVLIGRWAKLPEPNINELCIAALLHDVGMLSIPIELLQKPGNLEPEERAALQSHPTMGADILTSYSDAIRTGIRQHHERYDGSGYPAQLSGGQIHPYARIIAIADVYDAMASDRPYREKLTPYKALDQLCMYGFQHLDPNLINLFSRRVRETFIGDHVLLSNNKVGEVVLSNPAAPARPMVKVGDVIIDLSTDYSIDIIRVLNSTDSLLQA